VKSFGCSGTTQRRIGTSSKPSQPNTPSAHQPVLSVPGSGL